MEGAPVAVIDPSRLSFESPTIRRRIIAAYWITIVLAIPIWWKLTSIDRLSLPNVRVTDLSPKEWQPVLNLEWNSKLPHQQAKSLTEDVERIIGEDHGTSIRFVDPSNSETRTPQYEVNVDSHDHPPTLNGRKLLISDSGGAVQTAQLLKQLLWPSTLQSGSTQRVVQYSPRYRLAFSLLQEDATTRTPTLSWDIRGSIEKYLRPTLDKLSILHNFTIESQVQYHAPLAFTPTSLESDGKAVHGLTQEDLTVFVNSAEWTLSSSVSNDPVLHFVLFIPSGNNNPLYILSREGQPTHSNAFILPQWGGIVLLNESPSHLTTTDLHSSFAIFRHQLLALLGVPDLPPSVISDAIDTFSDWQLDALIRRRAQENIKNSKETLQSITKLVNQIQNMPVGQDVKGDVQDAIVALEQTFTGKISSEEALQHSAEALKLSSRAFFNPGMLALLYFPTEHTYGVYSPLFASIAAPLIAAVFREIKARRRERQQQAEQQPQPEPAERPRAE